MNLDTSPDKSPDTAAETAAETVADRQGQALPLTLNLGQELTIAYAAQHQAALAQTLLSRTGDLHLDLSAVDEFDSSGVQLLLSARRSLLERGDSLLLGSPSVTVRDALTVFGLQALWQPEAVT